MTAGKPGPTLARRAWLQSLPDLAANGPVEVLLFFNTRDDVVITTVERACSPHSSVLPAVRVLVPGNRVRCAARIAELVALSASGAVVPRGKNARPYGWIEPVTDEIRAKLERRARCAETAGRVVALGRRYQVVEALRDLAETPGGYDLVRDLDRAVRAVSAKLPDRKGS